MGTIAEGSVTVGGQKVNVKADFASDHVLFSGGRRGEVPYRDIEVVGTAKGLLRLRVDGAAMEFPLGDKVDRIAAKIRRPPTLMDKLGVKPGLEVAVVDVQAKPMLAELAEAAPGFTKGEPARPVDLLFYGLRGHDGLERIADLVPLLKPDGGLWVIYPKGRGDLHGAILDAGRAAGLKDVKVARVSPELTSSKFVRPLGAR